MSTTDRTKQESERQERITLSLPPKLLEKLNRIAKKHGGNRSQVFQVMLENYGKAKNN